MAKPQARAEVNSFLEVRQALQKNNEYMSAVQYAESGTDGIPHTSDLDDVFGVPASVGRGFVGFFYDTGDPGSFLVATEGLTWKYVILDTPNP